LDHRAQKYCSWEITHASLIRETIDTQHPVITHNACCNIPTCPVYPVSVSNCSTLARSRSPIYFLALVSFAEDIYPTLVNTHPLPSLVDVYHTCEIKLRPTSIVSSAPRCRCQNLEHRQYTEWLRYRPKTYCCSCVTAPLTDACLASSSSAARVIFSPPL